MSCILHPMSCIPPCSCPGAPILLGCHGSQPWDTGQIQTADLQPDTPTEKGAFSSVGASPNPTVSRQEKLQPEHECLHLRPAAHCHRCPGSAWSLCMQPRRSPQLTATNNLTGLGR